MPRYIDAYRAEKLLRMCGTYHGVISFDTVLDVLHDTQTADVVERKKGKWDILPPTDAWIYICDQCGRRSDFDENYCPECGAEMTGGDTSCTQ